jgi:hypothetical protein
MVPPSCQESSIKALLGDRKASSPLSSQSAMWVSRSSLSVTARFLTRSSVRLDIEGRRDQFDALADLDRSAMSAEQRARPGILVQQTPHRQSNRFGPVAANQLFGRLFDQRDDIRSGDSYDIRHIRLAISLMT